MARLELAAIDQAELERGDPLSRHDWLQGILDDPNIGPNGFGQNPPRSVCLSAMLARMEALTGQPERDMELEVATVALGRRFTSGPTYEGGSAVYEWVRTREAYEDLRTGWERYHKAEPKIVESDIVGIGSFYAGYALGADISGLADDHHDRWFMSFSGSSLLLHIPFDAITEVVDPSTQFYTGADNRKFRYGSVIESPTDRSGMFHGWRQVDAA